MDSKLRRMAIISSMAVILLVSILVLMMNPQENGNQGNHANMSSAQPETEEASAGQEQNTPSGQIGNDLSAFMKDNTFFDEEINPILEEAKNLANRLALVVTSVEKDLRVQIVDTEGSPVTGESFYVKLEGMGEYKDLDQDGIIYIGDLDAGEYYVELLPIEGYKVPVNETRVRVKDKVEYVAIEDISLLIKTEEEIDAEAEDSGVQDALSDADKSEIKKLQAATG